MKRAVQQSNSLADGSRDTHLANELFSPKTPGAVSAARWALSRIAAGLQDLYGNRCTDGFGILMYHRVTDHIKGVGAPTCNVTPSKLSEQLEGLLARGFVAWPLSALIECYRESKSVPPNVFAVTFDDGYENNLLNALPILKRLNVPATIFLATTYLDTNRSFPFDDWPASGSNRVPASAWRPLSTAQCHLLLESGLIELGAHTHTHGRFVRRRDEFCRDLALCLETLQKRFGVTAPTFAFPYGEYCPDLVNVARQSGVACCLTTHHQRVRPGDDVYGWGRFGAESSDTPAVLAAKLSGWRTTIGNTCRMVTQPFSVIASGKSQGRASSLEN
jgi:peptidoglycan/xylan/chitin deacetylase (PgdA/CDA1 family)